VPHLFAYPGTLINYSDPNSGLETLISFFVILVMVLILTRKEKK